MRVYQNMTDCDKLIKEACNFKLSSNDSASLEKCNKVMGDFRKGAESCKKKSTTCTCWNKLVNDIKSVKDCNIGENIYC